MPVPAGTVVIPASLDAELVARYQAALADEQVTTSLVDGPIASDGAVAIGAPVAGATAVVMPDPVATGSLLAEQLVGCLHDAGVVAGPVAVTGLPDAGTDTVERTLESSGFAAERVDPTFADWYRRVNGDVVGVVAGSGPAAVDAVAVLDANAQAGKVPVVGVGVGSALRARARDGSLCAMVRPAVQREATAAADLAARLAGGADPGEPALPTVMVSGSPVTGILVAPVVVLGEGEP